MISTNKMQNLLIAGSTGLIGSACLRLAFRKKDHNLFYPTKKELNYLNLENFINYCKVNDIDNIIYAVGKVGGILDNSNNQSNYLLYNAELALNLFKVAKSTNLKKIITFGSSCMYPLNAPQPFNEKSLFSGAVEKTSLGYAISKLLLSQGSQILNQENNLCKFITVIPNSCFGPNDDFNPLTAHVLSSLIVKFYKAKINRSKHVLLFGTGVAKREFIYSEDVANAVFFLLDHLNDQNDSRNLPINLGTGNEITILNLAKKIKNIVGYDGEIKFDINTPDGAMRKILDSSYLNGLGWKFTYTIDEALELTYKWYLDNYENKA